MSLNLNDVHSQLNATAVSEIRRPTTLDELQQVVRDAFRRGMKISVAGGRHAMGGQQFGTRSLHVDMTGLVGILNQDPVRGLLHTEAGAEWPAIIKATHKMEATAGSSWGIRQKQTGVDAVSLGGSISANAHGRGLLMRPLGDDIEDLTIINPEGETVLCSREQNAELFSLVIGGFGLFGIIYSATLRLAPRQRVERLVDVIDLDDAVNAVFRRAEDGCVYGDFQFAIDSENSTFLRRGVFACYKPVSSPGDDTEKAADLSPDSWLNLLKLAHEDKGKAFRLYAQHYLSTDGNRYWSDTMQLSTYLPSYVDFLESTRGEQPGIKETLVIGEHYVPRERLLEFMDAAKEIFKTTGTEVIYGTIRAILQDTVSFLPWAREDFACVVFNLRTRHHAEGVSKTAGTFRALIDASIHLGGSFFLTYHRYALPSQVEACYPEFREWLALKVKYDPAGLWTSDWYEHYRAGFASGS